MRTRKQLLVIILLFMLGVILYVSAAVSTFGLEFYTSGLDPFAIVALTCIGGFGSLALGYGSVIILGGMLSLRLTEFIARVTRSRHVIEISDEESLTMGHRVTRQDFLLYMPALVFILSAGLGWDIHNLHDPKASIFHPLLHALDIFSKPISVDPLSHSVDVIPAMVVLIAIAGLTPSMVLPYFRKFKITGVNSAPFHTNLLFTVLGLVVGLGALLTVVGLFYNVLWVGKGPIYYHYILPTMLGLSLHYTIGALLGRDKSEDIVITMLGARSGGRVFQGTVNIQGSTSVNKRKPS